MYAVCEFVDSKAVDVIPMNWIYDDDKSCLYPEFHGTKLTRAIKLRQDPQPEWKEYPIRILIKKSSYEEARGKLKMAEETSDLQTEPECNVKRKRRAPKHFESDSGTDEERDSKAARCRSNRARSPSPEMCPPTPPASFRLIETSAVSHKQSKNNTPLVSTSGSNRARSPSPEMCPPTPPASFRSIETSAVSHKQSMNNTPLVSTSVSYSKGASGICSSTPPASLRSSETSAVSRQQSMNNTPLVSTSVSYSKAASGICSSTPPASLRSSETSAVSRQQHTFQTVQAASASYSKLASEICMPTPLRSSSAMSSQICQSDSLFSPAGSLSSPVRSSTPHQPGRDAHILLALEELKSDLKYLTRLIQNHVREGESPTQPDVNLPLHTIEDVLKLEEKLENPNFKKQMVAFLGTVGGCSVSETTRRLMKTLLTNKLSQKFNFKGKGEKRGFSYLDLKNVVTSAVRRNPLTAQATDSEVEKTIKEWLRFAKDRDGGRKARN